MKYKPPIVRLYDIYDTVLGRYIGIDLRENDKAALRAFEASISKQSQSGVNPSDYELWYVGTYDMQTAKITDNNNCYKVNTKLPEEVDNERTIQRS